MELTQEVAKAVGRMMEITNQHAEAIVAETINSMIDALTSGDKVEIRGFGSFRLRSRSARRGRNPKTGKPVDVPSKQVVYFKMGADLKAFLKQS
jgi:integration host factor subunit beta